MALLRGVNVGKAKRIAMADLRALIEGVGGEDVRTLLNSGNAVFRIGATSGAALEKKLSSAIKADLGLDVKVIVRSSAELQAIVDKNPFAARGADAKAMGVSFLSGPAAAAKIKTVDRDEVAPDEFEVGKDVIYTLQPNGVLATRLPDWGQLLDVTVTARNWNTVTKLLDLAMS